MSLPIPINENKSYFSRDAADKFQPFVLELTTLAYTLDVCYKYKQIFWFVGCFFKMFLSMVAYFFPLFAQNLVPLLYKKLGWGGGVTGTS